MKKLLLSVSLIFTVLFCSGQKPPLDHSVYDGWKSIGQSLISDDGKWVTYEINPQQGDSWLYIVNATTFKKDSVFCGYGAKISPESRYLAYMVKPAYSELRQARKKKIKDDQMPKNNLIYLTPPDGQVREVKRVKSFEMPENGSLWMAYLLEKPASDKNKQKESQDTIRPASARNLGTKKPPESKGTELVILNPTTGKEYRHSDVVEYVVAKDGRSISFIQDFSDTTRIDRYVVSVFDTRKESVVTAFEGKGVLKKLTSDRTGERLSFIFTADTSKQKIFDLYFSRFPEKAVKVVDASNISMPDGWAVSENGAISFSDDGTRIYFGTAEKPVKEPQDTLLADEKYRVDIWSWQDDFIQPMQKLQLSSEQKRSYMAVYHTDRNLMFQLADKLVPVVRTLQKGNCEIALGSSDVKYRKLISWDKSYSDYYTINVETGVRTLQLEKSPSRVQPSPGGRYLVYWSPADLAYFSINTSTGAKRNISTGIKHPLFDEENDIPSDPSPYGIEGWPEDEKRVLIRDRFDIWSADLAGTEQPVNITNGFGRKNNVTFSYHRLDQDAEFIPKKERVYLSALNNTSKEAGYYMLRQLIPSDPSPLYIGKVSFSKPPAKAKKADKMIWIRGNFEICPELYLSGTDLSGERKLSVTNPQQAKYNWGTVELVEWNSFDNKKLQGLLYKPENFDPARKYPMIVYFYEKSSEQLYAYMPPAPARSTINRVYAASNGYLVFVPDITYEIGYPGKSCYNAVISGTNALLDRFPFIDRERLALDGQSWGGYQIAYLVTQTDLFRCAYSGAPVVNMISAYGGIRWESGMSRMFMYEHTQSRIGGTLWDKPLLFIENSPIFWIPRVNTPLLIMHNDADGAVPWYQGIEFITSLRRLGKPAWMLSYNDDGHNLTKRPNMKDLAIRKMQFYDHYLKDAPMPYWMKNGLTQLEKGKKDGYELVNDN